VFITYIII